MRISDGSSDVCSSDLPDLAAPCEHRVRCQLGPVVADDHPRSAALLDKIAELAHDPAPGDRRVGHRAQALPRHIVHRSEEHTSELQSLMRISYAVFCLKKKNNKELNNNRSHKQHSHKQ